MDNLSNIPQIVHISHTPVKKYIIASNVYIYIKLTTTMKIIDLREKTAYWYLIIEKTAKPQKALSSLKAIIIGLFDFQLSNNSENNGITNFFLAARRLSMISGRSPFLTHFLTK